MFQPYSPMRLLRARRAATAVVFGLTALPLLGLAAIAIDFSGAVGARSKLNLAASAAVLTASREAANLFTLDPMADLQPAITAGRKRFNAQAGAIVATAVQTPTLVVSRSGAAFTATITYTAAYSTAMSMLFGMPSVPLGGTSQAVVVTKSYVDLQLVMDTSGSMLIAATQTDADNLLSLTKQRGVYPYPADSWGWTASGCVFACHWDPGNNDFYAVSRRNNITLRLDQIKAASVIVAQDIQAKNSTNLYRMGVYTFGNNVTQSLALTTSMPNVISAINAVLPPLSNPNAAYETNLTQSLYQFSSSFLTTAGDGTSALAPRKFVFILTDGIDDVYASGLPSNRDYSPVRAAACDSLKTKGATIAVLHTLIIPSVQVVDPEVIRVALTNCASRPDLYFPVSDQAQINLAMQQMLNSALALPARFTR